MMLLLRGNRGLSAQNANQTQQAGSKQPDGSRHRHLGNNPHIHLHQVGPATESYRVAVSTHWDDRRIGKPLYAIEEPKYEITTATQLQRLKQAVGCNIIIIQRSPDQLSRQSKAEVR